MKLIDKLFTSLWPDCVLMGFSLISAALAGNLYFSHDYVLTSITAAASIVIAIISLFNVNRLAYRKGVEHWCKAAEESEQKRLKELEGNGDWWKSEKDKS